MPIVGDTLVGSPNLIARTVKMLKMILAATLLLTSLSSIGLISVWAARSRLPWFFRAVVFVAVVSMLLLIPAYEPLVVFSVQGAVVAVGIQLARWQRKNSDGLETGRRRVLFSLLTCLLVTAFFAIATAVAVRLPSLGFDAWQNVVLIGVVSGAATLLGVWVIAHRGNRWWFRLAAALVCCLGMTLVLERSDSFLESLVDAFSSWPSIEEDRFAWFGASVGSYEMFIAWASIVVGIMSFQVVAVWLVTGPAKSASTPDGGSPLHGNRKLIARFTVVVIASVLLAPPAFVYFRLMMPLPIPATVRTNPNGWMDIVAAGRMVENSSAISTISFYDTSSPKLLATAVKALTPVYERLDRGLRQAVHCPLEYSEDDVNVDVATCLRTLARALASRGRLAEAEDRSRDAADSYLQTIRFGFAARRGGLMIHSLVGNACSGVGRAHLYECHEDLASSDLLEFALALEHIEMEAEPGQVFVYRDRIWEQHAFGWHGHLCQILEEISVPESERIQSSFIAACDRELAEMRLLRTELAIQAFRATMGRLPNSLDEIVPEYIAEIPIDPMSPMGAALQYRDVDDGYLLYSVGYNGIDDGGVAPEELAYHTGDLRLDVLYDASP